MKPGYTLYSRDNQSFSDRVHQLAQQQVYPLIFDVEPSRLSFHPLPPEQAMTLDGSMGIDRRVEVYIDTFLAPIDYLVQERFRRYDNCRNFDDITITEWNHDSDLPSELHKNKAGLFVYGKYDEQTERFQEVIVIPWVPMTIALLQKRLPFERGTNKKNQSFIAVKIADLERLNLVLFRKVWWRSLF